MKNANRKMNAERAVFGKSVKSEKAERRVRQNRLKIKKIRKKNGETARQGEREALTKDEDPTFTMQPSTQYFQR